MESNTICCGLMQEFGASATKLTMHSFDYGQISPHYQRQLASFRCRYLPSSRSTHTRSVPVDRTEAHWLILFDKKLVAAVSLNRASITLGQLRQLVVHPKYQRQNLGQSLVRCVEQKLQQPPKLIRSLDGHHPSLDKRCYCLLHARPSAALFYRHLGYQPLGAELLGQEATDDRLLKPGLDEHVRYQWLVKVLEINPMSALTTSSADEYIAYPASIDQLYQQ